MLIKDFYEIIEFSITENQVLAQIKLNPDHEVYGGHFPDQPIVPGVIQLQIIKELMEKAFNKKLLLGEMTFAKFLKMVIPSISPHLTLTIDFKTLEKNFSFSAKIEGGVNVFTKVKGVFSSQQA